MTVADALITLQRFNRRVVPEWSRKHYAFQLVIEPWDYERHRPILNLKKKETGKFFDKNQCTTNPNTPTYFQQEIEQLTIAVAEHLLKKQQEKQNQITNP